MNQLMVADRGAPAGFDAEASLPATACMAVARLGSVRAAPTMFTVWVQLRGRSWIEAKEGKFRLRAGDWIAFDKESRPTLQADRGGLCIGIGLDGSSLQSLAELTDTTLYPGRSRLGQRDLRTALRLWRMAAQGQGAHTVRPLLLHLAEMQVGFVEQERRCPGRSLSRRRQVFSRMQRARLYLEGNSDRVVRVAELAQLTNFSSWYVSKTFQSLYDESPQALSARLRLERAADLLRDTSMMIGDVAAASGFDNCCSFARAFRARFGVSASHYRDEMALPPDSAKPRGVQRKAASFTRS
ncbi:MAG TPA: AraC family transcriptional regulator [Xanthomonadaceae bacterium]|nr:AraC family transcriptional regulator [Xanthomonadaceae bacterium]